MADVSVNGRTYRTPERPTVVVCFDGCDPAYIERGIADGILPTIASFRKSGFYAIADSVIPSFTNPNNASIVTGVPPAVHGISGNYYLDRATGEERMITDASLMRCGTILAAMAQAAVKTAAVTAKDKLRLCLARARGINFPPSMPTARPRPAMASAMSRPWSVARSRIVLGRSLALCAGCRSAAERKAATLPICRLRLHPARTRRNAGGNAFNKAVDDRIAAMMAGRGRGR
jgi:hypothetical protein